MTTFFNKISTFLRSFLIRSLRTLYFYCICLFVAKFACFKICHWFLCWA